jgi:hypothetical protein
MVQFVSFQSFMGGDHDNHFPWHDQPFKWPLHTNMSNKKENQVVYVQLWKCLQKCELIY